MEYAKEQAKELSYLFVIAERMLASDDFSDGCKCRVMKCDDDGEVLQDSQRLAQLSATGHTQNLIWPGCPQGTTATNACFG